MRGTTRGMTMMAAALVLAACEDGAGPNFSGAPSATLSFAVAGTAAGAPTFGGGPSAVVITDGAGRVLDVTQLQVVMQELELERANHDDCVNDDDACEEFETGPVLVDLPVEGGVISPFDVPIPADTYDELELEIDDAEDDSTSAAFFAAHPTWPHDASVRIVGTFDANDGAGPQPFDVYLEVDVEIERNLVPPLVVTDSSSSVNVTVAVDVGSWFLRESGDLIDPRLLDSDGGLADEVEGNIESSFDAYEDDDHDGEDDDSDDDGIDDEDEDDA